MTHELEGLDLITGYHRAAMRDYIEKGIRPRNEFLFAVITNNLFMAHFRANDNLASGGVNLIDDYITFLTKYAPPNCFGSCAKVEAWLEDAAERRALANHARAEP